eukprot:1195092-Prorocentrum_minimum.AAC.1
MPVCPRTPTPRADKTQGEREYALSGHQSHKGRENMPLAGTNRTRGERISDSAPATQPATLDTDTRCPRIFFRGESISLSGYVSSSEFRARRDGQPARLLRRFFGLRKW